jgi:hypothetical protein
MGSKQPSESVGYRWYIDLRSGVVFWARAATDGRYVG